MSLSLCVVARNEALNIERCLRSVTGAVQEIVVVDTGSTDDTPALAAAAGARVHHFPWCDDFAAAYNHAFDQARGTWILHLDADEELLPEGRAELRQLLRATDVALYRLPRREMRHPDDAGPYVEMWVDRLFVNRPELRLTGRDHPGFRELGRLRAEEGLRVVECRVPLRHRGYFAEQGPEKLARAARLLKLELADRPGQLYYEIELGRTLAALGDPEGPALLDGLIDRLDAGGWSPVPSGMVAALVEYALMTQGPDSRRWAWAERATHEWFPQSPPLLYRLGEHYMRRDAFAEALPYFERLVRLAEDGTYSRSIPFSAAYLGDAPFLFHAVCLHRLARFTAAERAYRRLLARYPEHPAGVQNLHTLRATAPEIRHTPRHKGKLRRR